MAFLSGFQDLKVVRKKKKDETEVLSPSKETVQRHDYSKNKDETGKLTFVQEGLRTEIRRRIKVTRQRRTCNLGFGDPITL